MSEAREGKRLMFAERRRHTRHAIKRIAKIATDSGALPRDCTITDISESGARLFTEAFDIPNSFHLLISGETQVRQACRVVWRLGGEVGVTFVTKEQEQERENAMKAVQAQARDVFRQHS